MMLEELRHDLKYMDREELIAFGRLHRANPKSVEYIEAKAEWGRRKHRHKPPLPIQCPADRPTSDELSEMARKAGRRWPWMRYED
jgi:hypothetical protein